MNEVFVSGWKSEASVLARCCFVHKINDVRKIILDNPRKTEIFAPKFHKKDTENSSYAVGGWYFGR